MTNEDHRQQIFIPTLAEFKDDIDRSWEIQKPLADAGYQPGFMLLVRKGVEGKPRVFDHKHRKNMYDGAAQYSELYGDAPIVTMLSNIPICDIDFLHNTQPATEHVLAGIELASNLPIGKRKILTFHTNTLVTCDEFSARSQSTWYHEKFEEIIMPAMRTIGDFARRHNVETLVESVPVPEFEDIPLTDKKEYHGVHWSELRNPFYIFDNNHIRRQLRDAGLGICLDICHNYTIDQAARDKNEDLLYKGDITKILGDSWSVLSDVSTIDSSKELIHLNDGRGKYTLDGGVYEEGIALGEGIIPNMEGIISTIKERRIPFVLEVNVGFREDGEPDFVNRPWVVQSINYLLNLEKSA